MRSAFLLSDPEIPVRLQRYLAACGIASRRKAEELILRGDVKVNGNTVRILGTKVTESDVVEYGGRIVTPEKKKLYIALHKPRGYICTSSDPEGRPTVLELLSDAYSERIYNIGRLDFNTSGLLLFTNDGEFARIVSHPSSQIEKEYLVETGESPSKNTLDSFKNGVSIDGVRYTIVRYDKVGDRTTRIVLIEGKNREIRRLFESAGHEVLRIHRTRIGAVHIGTLKAGEHRPLSKSEISRLFEQDRKGT